MKKVFLVVSLVVTALIAFSVGFLIYPQVIWIDITEKTTITSEALSIKSIEFLLSDRIKVIVKNVGNLDIKIVDALVNDENVTYELTSEKVEAGLEGTIYIDYVWQEDQAYEIAIKTHYGTRFSRSDIPEEPPFPET